MAGKGFVGPEEDSDRGSLMPMPPDPPTCVRISQMWWRRFSFEKLKWRYVIHLDDGSSLAGGIRFRWMARLIQWWMCKKYDLPPETPR